MLNIIVQRIGSFLGIVGFCFIVCFFSLSLYIVVDSVDFFLSEGIVMFVLGEICVILRINIIDDNVFEIEEGFFVQISCLKGGVLIGGVSKVDVIIKFNDDLYGFFGYVEY